MKSWLLNFLFLIFLSLQFIEGGVLTFRSPEVNLNIPDYGPAVSNSLSCTGLPSQISQYGIILVQTFITHSYPDDLVIQLISPSSLTKYLSNRQSEGNSGIFNGVIFDDKSSNSLDSSYFINPNDVRPKDKLSLFRGVNPNGNWTLKSEDKYLAPSGKLIKWTIQFTGYFHFLYFHLDLQILINK